MAHIPQAILNLLPVLSGLVLRSRGKVRDTYDLPGYPDFMLVVATDRISIFDFVLNLLIPNKGYVLNALNIFWRLRLGDKFKHDLIAYGAGIDKYLPQHLRNNPDLQKRAVVVRIISMIPREGVVRGYLLGTGWGAYMATDPHVVCGVTLPDGLFEGSKLPKPIFTPTTKAVIGHDEHITAESVEAEYPGFGARCVDLYEQAAEYAAQRGIIILDGKLEGSLDAFGDEWPTPDSCRFCLRRDYEKFLATGKMFPSLDKQWVRNLGKLLFIDKEEGGRKRDPDDPNDLAYVHSRVFPESVARMTTGIYLFSSWALTGQKIEDFHRHEMGISVPKRKLRIEVLVGSKTDLPQAAAGLALLEAGANVRVRVMSCDRNPLELADAAPELAKANLVIAGAGMSARLPSAVKSLLCAIDHPEVPVIGVAFKGDSDTNDQAARLAISQVPGQPVEMDENDQPYFGETGFTVACEDALYNEFLPKAVQEKPVELVKGFSE